MASTLKERKRVMKINEILKEMEEYGVTKENIKKELEYLKNESDNKEEFKNITLNEYIKFYYMSDRYIKNEEF